MPPKTPFRAEPRFPDPCDVVHDGVLTRAEKIEKLRRWWHDAQEIEVANDEGMRGVVAPSNLDAVECALRELDARASPG